MTQHQLFPNPELGKARRSDPPTAKQAAKSVVTAHLEGAILNWLATAPMTTHELAESIGVQLVSISPRMRPLVEKNLVVDSGQKRVGASGRKSIVWRRK